MSDILDALRGKKTFFVAAVIVVLAGLHAQGYLSDASYSTWQGILTGAGLAALRAGVAKDAGKK